MTIINALLIPIRTLNDVAKIANQPYTIRLSGAVKVNILVELMNSGQQIKVCSKDIMLVSTLSKDFNIPDDWELIGQCMGKRWYYVND